MLPLASPYSTRVDNPGQTTSPHYLHSSVDTTTQSRPSNTTIHLTQYPRTNSPSLVQKGTPAPHTHQRRLLPPANAIEQPPTSDNDREEYIRNTQTHEPTTATQPANHLSQITPTAQRKGNTEEDSNGSHSGNPQPRFPGKDKSIPQPSPAITTSAANTRTDSIIRTWYREHTGPIHPTAHTNKGVTTKSTNRSHTPDPRKDPAQPTKPDDAQLPDPTVLPLAQRSPTTVMRPGGYPIHLSAKDQASSLF